MRPVRSGYLARLGGFRGALEPVTPAAAAAAIVTLREFLAVAEKAVPDYRFAGVFGEQLERPWVQNDRARTYVINVGVLAAYRAAWDDLVAFLGGGRVTFPPDAGSPVSESVDAVRKVISAAKVAIEKQGAPPQPVAAAPTMPPPPAAPPAAAPPTPPATIAPNVPSDSTFAQPEPAAAASLAPRARVPRWVWGGAAIAAVVTIAGGGR